MTAESQTPEQETLDLIFDWVRGDPSRQRAAGDVLDTKIFQILGIGSFILGLAAFIGRDANLATTILLVLAVIAYVACALVALLGLRVRRYGMVEYAEELWPAYKGEDADGIKEQLIGRIKDVSKQNNAIIEDKAKRVQWVMCLLILEAILLGLAAISIQI